MSKQFIHKMKFLIKKKPTTLNELVLEYDLSEEEIEDIKEALKKDGYVFDDENNAIKIKNKMPEIITKKIEFNSNKFKICMLSDTHLGSIYDRLDVLDYIYEKGDKKDIDFYFHSGDFFEGILEFPNHQSELVAPTFFDQIQYAFEKYPVSNKNTFIINGNHEIITNKKEKRDLLEELQLLRNDLIYLKGIEAHLQIGDLRILIEHGSTNNLKMKINAIKKKLDRINEERKPHLMQTGHMHMAFYLLHNDTNVFQTPALMLNRHNNLPENKKNENGVWWLELELDEKKEIVYLQQELEVIKKKFKKRL